MRDCLDAAGWAAHEDAHWCFTGEVNRRQIAIGFQDADCIGVIRKHFLQVLHVALDYWLDDGIRSRRNGALVFLYLWQHVR